MGEPARLLNTKEEIKWLEEKNYKARFIRQAIQLKQKLRPLLYNKYLEIHEARDTYLNQMPILDLENLVKDLEKEAKKQ